MLPQGYYNETEGLLRTLNSVIKNSLPAQSTVVFSFKPHTRRVYAHLSENVKVDWKVQASYLGKSLGFTSSFLNSSSLAEQEADLNAGLHFAYIYCNILQTQTLADTQAQLLCVIPIPQKQENFIQVNFDRPQYVRVATNLVQEIQIEIRDASGREFQFKRGTSYLKLHFIKV